MKKTIIFLLTIFLLGCMEKTDERGFYIEGNKIGYNKETKTLYDKDGYDKDGYNEKGWNRSGINKITKTLYDKDGYNEKGWNEENLNKITKTLYDKDGYDIRGWSEDGINRNTGYTFNEKGLTKFYIKPLFKKEDSLNKPYNLSKIRILEFDKYCFIEIEDEFTGTYYISKSYHLNSIDLLMDMFFIETASKMESLTLEMQKIIVEKIEKVAKEMCNIYLDVFILVDRDKNINSYLDVTFCSFDKIYNIKGVEFLINNKVLNLPISNTTLGILKIESLGMDFTTDRNIYFNQIKINLTDELFDILSKLKIDENITIRILADNKDIRFDWTNKLDYSDDKLYIKGLPAGLGYYYNLKNNK